MGALVALLAVIVGGSLLAYGLTITLPLVVLLGFLLLGAGLVFGFFGARIPEPGPVSDEGTGRVPTPRQ